MSQNGFSLQIRTAGGAGSRNVIQYGEWSESTLASKLVSRSWGRREGVSRIKSMRDMVDLEGVKQEKRGEVGCLYLHVSVRLNSARNRPNLVVLGVEVERVVRLRLSRLGVMTIFKSPAQMAGTVGCWVIKAIPIHNTSKLNGG